MCVLKSVLSHCHCLHVYLSLMAFAILACNEKVYTFHMKVHVFVFMWKTSPAIVKRSVIDIYYIPTFVIVSQHGPVVEELALVL